MGVRNIIFKAKRIDNGEWVQGYVFDDGFVDSKRMFVGGLVIMDYKGKADDRWEIGTAFYEVDPKTICQYTGLTNKNGNKIWENDILFAKEPYVPTCPFSIRYNQETLSYVGLYDGFGKIFELSKELLSCSEVIGNIFDNPELLKGE